LKKASNKDAHLKDRFSELQAHLNLLNSFFEKDHELNEVVKAYTGAIQRVLDIMERPVSQNYPGLNENEERTIKRHLEDAKRLTIDLRTKLKDMERWENLNERMGNVELKETKGAIKEAK